MTDMGTGWEDLRRRACQLENELDLKLVSFSKLGTGYRTSRDHASQSSGMFKSVSHRSHTYSGDPGTPLSKSSAAHMFEVMSTEIEQLLAALTQVNDRMSEAVHERGGLSPTPTLTHTLQRHRDILQDYAQEYNKTRLNIVAVREREELLNASFRDNSSYRSGSSVNDLYLKEHDHLLKFLILVLKGLRQMPPHISDRLVDEQISIAMATKENMQSQRSSLKSITHRINLITNRFPAINSLIMRIGIRKRRDSIILAGVIAVCVIIVLWYTLR